MYYKAVRRDAIYFDALLAHESRTSRISVWLINYREYKDINNSIFKPYNFVIITADKPIIFNSSKMITLLQYRPDFLLTFIRHL